MSAPLKHFHDALHDFLCMASDRPQAQVLQFFLDHVVRHSDLCSGGVILVFVPESDRQDGRGHLKVWDFTMENDMIQSLASLNAMKVDLPTDMGISTVAFRKRWPEFAPIANKHPQYWWPSGGEQKDPYAEGPCYSIPIRLINHRGRSEPFGVVTFQNPSESPMREMHLKNMDLAVKSLEAMMSLSPKKLSEDSTVFIVHGRDHDFRKKLETILTNEGLTPVVIQSMARTGVDLLGFLEDKIHNCLGGFILLTPDDEGRLYDFGQPLRQRARQNVIFEAGYLTALFRDTNRICFLLKGSEMEIPSDLKGLLMETVDGGSIDPERIRLTLRQWGLLKSGGTTAAVSPSSFREAGQEEHANPPDPAKGERVGDGEESSGEAEA